VIRARIQRSYQRDGYDLWLVDYDVMGNGHVAKPITIEFGEARGEAFILPEPTLFLKADQLKALAEGIVESGALPEDMIRNQRELSAVKGHLEDMRTLTFHTLKVQK
jgi:hypothetical protein